MGDLTLIAIYKRFPTAEDCIAHLEQIRWQGTPICPHCESSKSTPMTKERRYRCNGCNTSYSVTVKTLFHKTHVDLQKWYLLITLVINNTKDPSVRSLAERIQVNKNTANYMAMRVRRALTKEINLLLSLADDVQRGDL
jgi:transposase-like protein